MSSYGDPYCEFLAKNKGNGASQLIDTRTNARSRVGGANPINDSYSDYNALEVPMLNKDQAEYITDVALKSHKFEQYLNPNSARDHSKKHASNIVVKRKVKRSQSFDRESQNLLIREQIIQG